MLPSVGHKAVSRFFYFIFYYNYYLQCLPLTVNIPSICQAAVLLLFISYFIRY